MTANAYERQALLYENETLWAEATDTWAEHLQILDTIDISGLEQALVEMNVAKARMGEGVFHRRGVQGGSFTFDVEAGGHGTTAAGALAATDLYNLLVNAFGNGDATSVGTTCDGAGDAGAPGVAAGTFADGSIARIGTNDPRDARGNGQAAAVDNLAGNVLTLENDLDGAPALADVVYAMLLAYPEVVTSAVQSMRFNFQTSNLRWKCRGCWFSNVELLGTNPGESMTFRFTTEVSTFAAESASTWPPTIAADAKCGAPVSGGSLHVGIRGSQTRALVPFSELSIDFGMNIQELLGPGGADRQLRIGARRIGWAPTIEFTDDAEEATATPEWDAWWATDACAIVAKWVVLTLSAADGRCLALSLPNCRPAMDWNRPTQVDVENLNRVRVKLEAMTTPVITTDLTLAPFVLGIG